MGGSVIQLMGGLVGHLVGVGWLVSELVGGSVSEKVCG